MSDSSEHPCAYHYHVAGPDWWCEVCQKHVPPTPKPKTPLSVRLARVARPGYEWASDGEGNAYERHNDDHMFFLDSLDNLAEAEAKVRAAGLEKEYSHEIRVVLRQDNCWPDHPSKSRTVAVRTMKPEQIVRALAAVLDANPERFPEAR